MAHWKQRETVFAEYELALTLPGRWQLRPSDSPTRWLYRSAEKPTEHLTILREEPGEVGDDDATLRRIVARQRRAMELGFGRVSDLTMSEPESGERGGVPTFCYSGSTPSAHHRFHVFFAFPPRTVWILVYDAFRLDEAQADAHAEVIFASVALR
ncbi:MAG: hypothetical protein NTZ46_04765 [Verrucomicrobia bacterium]|nr:hypothetical protein [Verrucomicrobiota bacterium]